ncbi:MAG TPA: thioesterase family protein [Gaiellales bacterium]|nr:thioesterase family protein [Gaiellales bacterium]
MPSLPPSVYTKRVEIRWRDMDAFKHVNNSVYLTYLEETRDEWFLQVLGNGLLLNDFVLARCAVDYRSPLTQDDGDVDVELRCTRVGRSSITTAERVMAALDGRVAAEAEAVLVHYDWETGKSRPLTEEIRAAFARWTLE